MLELRFIRENPEMVKENLRKRNDPEKLKLVDKLLELDMKHRELMGHSQELRAKRNTVAEEINRLKKEGKDVQEKIREAKEIPQKIREIEEEQEKLAKEIHGILYSIPNMLHDSVPLGQTEEDNVLHTKHGKIPEFDFEPLSHVDLLERGLADIDRAGKVSGARFYYLKNELVMLDYALQKFALDFLYKKKYSLIEPPFLMRREPYEGVTDLHDFEDVMYKVENDDLYLIATAEHPIAAMYMNEVLEEKELPLKFAGISPAFRKEAGAHGKDQKGIFRVHHFNKIEQFIFSRQEDSWKYHEELLKNAEQIFQKLDLPYRVVNICTADIGTVAAKKYDIEVWYPVQKQYREVASISNCTSYQATRLNIKYRTPEGNMFVHTLNGTAIATSRAIVAILENFQEKDGSISVPKALHKYMAGIKKIVPRQKQ